MICTQCNYTYKYVLRNVHTSVGKRLDQVETDWIIEEVSVTDYKTSNAFFLLSSP